MDMPFYRDRLMKLQARTLANKYHGMRLLSKSINREPLGVEELLVKLSATELSHDIYSLGVDVLGELGTLYDGSPHQRERDWQKSFLSCFTGIIGGGSANIQKNIISERGLGMPREPLVAYGDGGWSMIRREGK